MNNDLQKNEHDEGPKDKGAINRVRRARKLALQALYQWHMSGIELYEIEAQFRVAKNMDKVDTDYFCRLLYGISKEVNSLEAALQPFIDRPIESLNPIELTVLRIGTFELFHCLEIPCLVVLDSSIALAKEFGSQDGYRYVNGVLNNLAKKVRTVEMNG